MLNNKQQTLKESFTLCGRGLHTGAEATISFHPAKENYGYRFVRTDFDENIEIPALAKFVADTARSTILEKDGAKLQTIEHVLSALYGCQIDNCRIELDSEEPPILDGSSKPFVDEILRVGIEEQDAPRKFFKVREPISVYDKDTGAEVTLLPDNDFKIDTHIAYDGSPLLSNQFAQLRDIDDYAEEIAHCRTFVFFRELEILLQNNLVKGGDLDNAIVILDKEVPQAEIDRLAELFGKETKLVSTLGSISNEPLRYSNEPARHKLLDVIGDLALCGSFIKGRVIATRPGHKINTKMAKKILSISSRQAAPIYDPNTKPALTTQQIKKLLPHRYPFLLIDKVLEISNDRVIGIKNITYNEMQFLGHFPDEPIMPGVLIVESMAQCGGLMILNRIEEPQKHSTYFMKIDNFKFRKKVVPGDTILFDIYINKVLKRGIICIHGYAYVGSELVAEGDLMAQIIRNK
ncbi:3-hydroxyacyl-[acyl-carrier-protein] dehydratase /UDP-3-O-[3-hydroxymyristoyl] N-acetylglucosamine deacetylase [Balneicella halophila]|uniref:Multifunctional fusion protein n=1 Tax=Balneicella halophila TaxID=1537566 RepID=A0A7L4UQR6_BALHA|nr:bifunctional UDP-3-O-[3-hydroxymyristoyl] N-acetylglucosamine deacetylase/3-hydroxyacyl-ACP dehydratase [Balneicella halophila]PVX52118.1 3-hydroxyacyl-[acyl-carrier-protein] dehydratase /UDP-3-O-[3-hydroxymyristoyl] N-acetylglucosamine deacetylase [Balneicella halophila]